MVPQTERKLPHSGIASLAPFMSLYGNAVAAPPSFTSWFAFFLFIQAHPGPAGVFGGQVLQ